jgi:hypothetical protein
LDVLRGSNSARVHLQSKNTLGISKVDRINPLPLISYPPGSRASIYIQYCKQFLIGSPCHMTPYLSPKTTAGSFIKCHTRKMIFGGMRTLAHSHHHTVINIIGLKVTFFFKFWVIYFDFISKCSPNSKSLENSALV